ncbi:MAG: hypothetical protein KDE33_17780 [Bacteroidetes bacterium]|nr:hypothetical protein [Bacteroidota bacterium]MCB9280949.1 hypothetical protein [Lewinellaceae bacterium]
MIDKIKKFLGISDSKSNPSDGDDNEQYTPEEIEKLNLIRSEKFDYQSEADKIQIKNFFQRLIGLLKIEGWTAQKIVDFIRKFFSKSNRLQIWNEFAYFIRKLAGLTDFDDVDKEIDKIS